MDSPTTEQQLQRSIESFNRLRPILIRWFHGGEILSIESCRNVPLLLALDQLGLDFLHRQDGKGRFGSSRIQFTERPFDTFTIRRTRDSGTMTEYDKIIDSTAGTIGSYWFVQAYCHPVTNEVLAAAMVDRDVLKTMLTSGTYAIKHTKPGAEGGAAFLVIRWEDIQKCDLPIKIYRKSSGGI